MVAAWALTPLAVSLSVRCRTAPLFCDRPARCGCPLSARLSHRPAPPPVFRSSTRISCATCRAPIAQSAAAAVPVNFDLIASLQAAEGAAAHVAALRLQVEQAHAAHGQTAVLCTECDQTATLFCEQCDFDFCAGHSKHVHALKMFHRHNVMRVAEKAAFLAEKLRRDAQGKAQKNENKCALHPDQLLYLYCTDCSAAICTVCAHGKHHSHGRLEIDEAVTQLRADQAAKLAWISSGDENDFAGIASITASRQLAQLLGHMLKCQSTGTTTTVSETERSAVALLPISSHSPFSLHLIFCSQRFARRQKRRSAISTLWSPI